MTDTPSPVTVVEADREAEMVVLARDEAGTATIWCDPEIADLVRALNEGGARTVASCSGHGLRPGMIALGDGRELLILPNYDAARKLDRLFLDIHGNIPRALSEAIDYAQSAKGPDQILSRAAQLVGIGQTVLQLQEALTPDENSDA